MSSFYARIRRHRPRAGHGTRRWVFLPYDQLRPDHPLLVGPPGQTGVVYVETAAKPARRPYHKQKLVLLLSAMRHDALERGKRGQPVLYHSSERWYDGALEEVREEHGVDGLEALAPAEAEVREPLEARSWITLHPNSLFITDTDLYRSVFPKSGRQLLERFYRAARRETGLLMDGDAPAGGTRNLDKRAPRGGPAGGHHPRPRSGLPGGLDRRARWGLVAGCSLPGTPSIFDLGPASVEI